MENEVLEILKRLESKIDDITMDVKEVKSYMVNDGELFSLMYSTINYLIAKRYATI